MPDMSSFLAGLRKERFLWHFPHSVRKYISFLDVKGPARVSLPLGKPSISCYNIKNRNDLILTKHFPLGIATGESIILCTGLQITCCKQNPGFPRKMYSFGPPRLERESTPKWLLLLLLFFLSHS